MKRRQRTGTRRKEGGGKEEEEEDEEEEAARWKRQSSSPLGAVGVARVALVVGLGVLEDEAAGTLQAVRTLLHTVGAVFEVEALHAVLGALWIGGRERRRVIFFPPFCPTRRECSGGAAAC